ncbi:MAG TPA: response regulator [Terriglobales bacterium]|nr:response regulator [Terriglobales bacterium]
MGEAAYVAPLRGMILLLVEDHEDARDLFQSMLEYGGAHVIAAATVDEALELTSGMRVDVVVTDIGLRPKPGTWFVEEGRHWPRLRGVPVVAVTGRDIPTSLRATFDAVVDKPVDADVLTRAILRVSRRR